MNTRIRSVRKLCQLQIEYKKATPPVRGCSKVFGELWASIGLGFDISPSNLKFAFKVSESSTRIPN